MRARRVGVIGLGLMGGSLARALAARGVQVMGYDREQSFLDAAVAEGIVHQALDARGVTGGVRRFLEERFSQTADFLRNTEG